MCSFQTQGRGGWVFTHVLTSHRCRGDPLSCSHSQLHPLSDPAPHTTHFHRSLPPLPALSVCLPRLPARKSDAVIAPCAADREEPLSPPAQTPPPSLRFSSGRLVAAAVRMWSPQRSALHPSASTGEEDEMFFPLPPVPLPPAEHHPVLHMPHRR